MKQVRAELRISGRVQGVWFRQSTRQVAEKFGVNGWVRNCADGSVEAVLEGEQDSVQSVVDWCRNGPELARVDDLQLSWKDAEGLFCRFEVH